MICNHRRTQLRLSLAASHSCSYSIELSLFTSGPPNNSQNISRPMTAPPAMPSTIPRQSQKHRFRWCRKYASILANWKFPNAGAWSFRALTPPKAFTPRQPARWQSLGLREMLASISRLLTPVQAKLTFGCGTQLVQLAMYNRSGLSENVPEIDIYLHLISRQSRQRRRPKEGGSE